MNKLDRQYQNLLQDILDNGVNKLDRTGTGTLSVFGRHIRHKMSDGFPLLTTKKMYFRGVVAELLWFLRGDTNIKYLVDNDCHIWDGDAYQAYLKEVKKINPVTGNFIHLKYPEEILSKEEFINKIKTDDEFAKKWGELGPIYGKQWRNWCGYEKVPSGWEHGAVTHYREIFSCDQIANAIKLLKTDPDSRRNKVSTWNVGELDQMVLPPCHTDFQFYTRELSLEERIQFYYKGDCSNGKSMPDKILKEELKSERTINMLDKLNIPTRAISLMWNQRSVDTFLGLPFNIASYGLLLEIIAKMVNMIPDELIGNLGDTHLYLNHIEQAKEQIGKIPWEERKEMLTNPTDISEFGNISPFTEPIIHHWLDYKKIPYSRRMPYPLPTLKIVGYPDEYFHPYDENLFNDFEVDDFVIENYQSHPAIKAPLSN